MTLNAKIGGFTDFFRDIGLCKFISFTRRRHRRHSHTRLWPMCIMVPMGRVQVICDFRNYNYWTGNAIGFRTSRELCSNFLLLLLWVHQLTDVVIPGLCKLGWGGVASQAWHHDLIAVIRAWLDRNQATAVRTVEHLGHHSLTLSIHSDLQRDRQTDGQTKR